MKDIETALQKTLGFGAKEFIEKAWEGGWSNHAVNSREYPNGISAEYNFSFYLYRLRKDGSRGRRRHVYLASILLDPASWQAVGKVEGWEEKYKHSKSDTQFCPSCRRKPAVDPFCPDNIHDEWKDNMHRFIDTLTEEV